MVTALKRWVFGLAAFLLLALFSITTFRNGEGTPAKVAGGAATPPAIPAPAPAPGVIDLPRLQARLDMLMQDPAMVGMGVAVIEGGRVRLLRGYGETLQGSGDPVTPDTVFRWASLSKGVTGAAVLKLAERGKVALDDPIAKHSALLRLPGGGEQRATVADILSHRTGLNSNAWDDKLEDGADARLLRQSLATVTPRCPPGTCHAYQNVAFDSTSDLAERATGKPMPDVLAAELFAPLGMRSATTTLAGLQTAASWARGHRGGGPAPIENNDNYYRVPAAGGVNSSIRDLARWMLANMGHQPGVLPPKLLENLHRPRVATPGELGRQRRYRERLTGANYALGWRNYEYAGRRLVGHNGGVNGYRAAILFDPRLQTGVAVLWNGPSRRPWSIEYEVMDMIYALEPRDWLELDGVAPTAPLPLAEPPQPLANATLAQTGR